MEHIITLSFLDFFGNDFSSQYIDNTFFRGILKKGNSQQMPPTKKGENIPYIWEIHRTPGNSFRHVALPMHYLSLRDLGFF
jgi:hypothetical protein